MDEQYQLPPSLSRRFAVLCSLLCCVFFVFLSQLKCSAANIDPTNNHSPQHKTVKSQNVPPSLTVISSATESKHPASIVRLKLIPAHAADMDVSNIIHALSLVAGIALISFLAFVIYRNSRLSAEIRLRSAAEEELRKSEERYRRIVETTTEGIWEVDSDFKTVYANARMAEMLGYSRPEEMIGLSVEMFWFDEDTTLNKEHLRKRMQGQNESFHRRFRRQDGSELWVNISATARLEADGLFQGSFAMLTDITERVYAERARKAQEEQFSQLFRKHDAVMLLIDPKTAMIVDANLAAEKYYGYPTEQLLGMHIGEINTLSGTEIAGIIEKATRSQQNYFVLNHRLATGEVKKVEVHTTPIDIGDRPLLFSVIHDVTNRIKAEEALKDSERRLKLAQEAAKVGIWEWNIITKEYVLTPELYNLLGWMPDSVKSVHDSWFDGIRPEDRLQVEEEISIAVQNGEELNIEWWTNEPNQSPRRLMSRGQPIRDGLGKIVKYVGIVIDITERKKYEEDLEARERLLDNIFEIIPVGLWITNSSGKLLRTNPEGRRIWGAEPLVGREEYGVFKGRRLPSRQEIAPDDWALVHTLNTGKVCKDELLEIDAFDGQKRTIFNYCAPVLDGKGRISAAVIVNLDVTERMKVAEELRSSEERYRKIVETAKEGIWILDADFRTTFVNNRVAEMLGYTVEEILRVPVAAFVAESDLLDHQARLPQFRNEINVLFERKMVRKDGSEIWVLISATSFLDKQGEFAGCFSMLTDITEHKSALEKLQNQVHFMESLMSAMPAPVYFKDINHVYRGCNQRFADLMGLTRSAIIGNSVFEVAPKEIADIYRHRDESLFENPGIQIYETYVKRPDGSLRNVIFHKATFNDAHGAVAGLIGVLMDITELKRTEDALKESERRIATLMGNLPGMAYRFFYIHERVMAFVSNGCHSLTGYSSEELLSGKVQYDGLIHPDDRKRVAEAIAVGSQATGSFELEYRIVTKSGTEKWVWEKGSRVSIGESKLVGFEGFISDITERKRIEQDLKTSEERFRAVLENLNLGISVINCDMELLTVNPHMKKLYSNVDPQVGELCYRLFNDPQSTGPCKDCPSVKAFMDGAVHEMETEYEAEGRIRQHRVVACPVKNQSGGVEMVVTMVDDMTERHSLYAQLAHAQKMEAIGTLAGGVAHDFNNVLHIVMGYSELLLSEDDLAHEVKEDLRKILHSVTHGADLVKRLLTFSRKVELKPKPIDINQRITGIKKMIDRVLTKTVEIDLVLNPDIPRVNADPTQIDQLIMNLVLNARDAMPAGGTLTIETSSVCLNEEHIVSQVEASVGIYVSLTVSDTGMGMDRDTLQHIFEPFYTTKGVGRGTGLGLAMVHGIVTHHNGHITCTSEPGKGTSFKMYFPAITDHII